MGQLSIDFRLEAIRLLETEGSVKSLKVKKFRMLEFPALEQHLFEDESAMGAVKETLDKVISKNKFPRDPAGMALGSSFCIFRDLELPFKNEDQIRKVIKFEVEGTIQTDIDDMVISFFKKTETIDKSYLMVLGVKKATLRQPLALLHTGDVDPYFVDLDLLCLYNALAATGVLQELEHFFVINASYESTQILALSAGRLFAARSIPLGVGGLIRALRHDMKMGRFTEEGDTEEILGITSFNNLSDRASWIEEAEEPGTETDFPEKRQDARLEEVKALAEERRKGFLTRLRREMIRTLTSMNPEEKAEKILVTGAGCCLPGLSEQLQELIGCDVEELDLLSRIDHPFSEEDAARINREIGVSLGAAYKSAGHDVTRVDFRQEDLQYTKKFEQIKVPLACLAFLMLIFIVLLNLELFMFRKSERVNIDNITGLAAQKLRTALEDTKTADEVADRLEWGMPRILGISREITKKSKDLGNQLGREGTIPELPSVFPVWHQFFSVMERHVDEMELFKLGKMKIQMMQKTPVLTFDCEVASGEDESNLERFLESVPIFTRIKRGQSRPTPEGNREMKDMQIEIDLAKLEVEK